MSKTAKTRLAALAVLLLFGCSGSEEPEGVELEVREVSTHTIQDFLGTTNFRGASFSPDQTHIMVSSDQTGVYNAYALPVDGGEPVPLTNSTTDSVFAIGYFPADERILFQSDQGGNELTHIHVREIDGSVRDLTPGDELKAAFLGWAQDDTSFFVGTNERDQRYFDIYEYSVDGYGRERIYQDDTGYDFADISADRRHLAFSKNRTTTDSDVYLLDRNSGEMKHLTPHEGNVANSPDAFSPDGGSLYYRTDDGSEFAYLVRYDLVSGTTETLVEPEWDVLYARPSRTGKYLAVGINHDASTEIRVYDTTTMEAIALPELPDADITSVTISRDERQLAFYVSSGRHPRDLYLFEMGADSATPLTRSLPSSIDAEDLVDGEVVRFASYDGVEVPGILYRPHQVGRDGEAPALVWVHGGPGGQSRIGYSGLLQYLVNHGYVVYAINNRGSSGYGKTFFSMDDRNHGEADLKDCIASKKMLIDTGLVDPERIGIIGGSYGGYMVLAALTLAPEEFTVGVDLFGISNWVRTLESIPPWWESFREALYQEMGDPTTDGERLRRISPLFSAGNIVRPLMVLQGANDPRVLQVESDDIVQAARENGVIVEYLIFEDEGHGFRKKENQLKGYQGILGFLNRNMQPSS